MMDTMKCLANRLMRVRFTQNMRRIPGCMRTTCRRYSDSPKQSILFSGIQPTGVPHLGNYLGAVQNWVKLQDEHQQCIFAIVDLHSLTKAADPATRRQDIMDTAITLLACGIDPAKCVLFQQSDVKEHAELSWMFTCMITEPRLKQVPQWKEKAKLQSNFSFGLICYPLLMAADILLYKATHVPVGADQIQQIQLCRDIAKLFNSMYNTEFFPQSECLFTEVPRIRSLRDPDQKMSKSDVKEKSRINLDDDMKTVRLKIKQAVTDCTSEVYYSEDRPGVSNLIDIHSALSGLTHEDIRHLAKGMDTGQYKLHVADVVNEHLNSIRSKIDELRHNKDYVQQILDDGKRQATQIASDNIDCIKQIIGLK